VDTRKGPLSGTPALKSSPAAENRRRRGANANVDFLSEKTSIAQKKETSSLTFPFEHETNANTNATMDDRFKFMCTLLVGHTVRAKVSWKRKKKKKGERERSTFDHRLRRRLDMMMMMLPHSSFYLFLSRPLLFSPPDLPPTDQGRLRL